MGRNRANLSISTQPTTTRQILAAGNPYRREVLFYNNGGQAVFLGGSGVTTSAFQVKLEAAASFIDEYSANEWYGVTASGTADIQGYETSE
jgi:hypothetical protein